MALPTNGTLIRRFGAQDEPPDPEYGTTAQQVVAEQNSPQEPVEKDEEKASAKRKKLNEDLRADIENVKNYRRKLIQNWTINIDYRRGKPFASQTDDDQVAVNSDWSLTKTKQAALFSQIPEVRINHHPESVSAPWTSKFQGRLNDTLVLAGIEGVMDECVPDCVNAAGLGVALITYESITQDKSVPKIDLSMLPPELQQEAKEKNTIQGVPIPMETVPQKVDSRYIVERVSPADFLWPLDFINSNFDRARWLGRSGRITWSEALQRFKSKLKESDRDSLIESRSTMDTISNDLETQIRDEKVGFDEVFYHVFQHDPEANSFSTIHHVVFIEGKKEPVIDEPWKGQQVNPDTGEVVGSMKLPIRVLTLAYITDEAIPPSDSAIARPQVNELNKSRTQMIKQRERNLPVRWFDVNRVDPTIQQALMKGTWQHMIPVQGAGDRVLGEVSKATHPVENFKFDEIAKRDLNELWTIGPNQMGSGADVETKGESGEIAASFQTRVGRERAKVGAFFTGIAEVLGGLLCLYEDPAQFGEGFNAGFSKAISFSILADSTVLIDSNQRLKRLNDFINTYAKTGFVALEPCLREVALLIGLDPDTVVKAPEPTPPAEPNISLRLTGTEDMMNPLTLAFLIKSGQAPPPELVEQAKQLIQAAVLMPQQAPVGPDGLPMSPTDPNAPPGAIPPPGSPMPPMPGPPPTPVGEAHPEASILPTINKRSETPNPQ